MNLLSNAAEAISGRGEVMIKTENRISNGPFLAAVRCGRGLRVMTVTDTGEVSPRRPWEIFEPFYTKRSWEEAGPGLDSRWSGER